MRVWLSGTHFSLKLSLILSLEWEIKRCINTRADNSNMARQFKRLLGYVLLLLERVVQVVEDVHGKQVHTTVDRYTNKRLRLLHIVQHLQQPV